MSQSRSDIPRLSIRCRDTACRKTLRADLTLQGATTLDCPACGKTHALRIDEVLVRDGAIGKCAVCDGTEFFIRKDFPQRLGMTLVVLFGLVATFFYSYKNIPATFGTLAALVVVDAAIYLFVGLVTACYRCRAEYRGLARNPRYGGFDLATSEKYDPAS